MVKRGVGFLRQCSARQRSGIAQTTRTTTANSRSARARRGLRAMAAVQHQLFDDEEQPRSPAAALAATSAGDAKRSVPLAERLRPRTLDEVIGQAHLLAPGQPLRVTFQSGRVYSMNLWACLVWRHQRPPRRNRDVSQRRQAVLMDLQRARRSRGRCGQDRPNRVSRQDLRGIRWARSAHPPITRPIDYFGPVVSRPGLSRRRNARHIPGRPSSWQEPRRNHRDLAVCHAVALGGTGTHLGVTWHRARAASGLCGALRPASV